MNTIENTMTHKDVSQTRKFSYYCGMLAIGIGIIIIIIFFTQTFSSFGDAFGKPLERPQIKFHLPIIGFLLAMAGTFMMRVGREGLAGSGVILSPEGQRKDFEPWNRSKGRQIQDALEETQLDEMLQNRTKATTLIKVKCRACEALNDEEDKFCGQCGKEL